MLTSMPAEMLALVASWLCPDDCLLRWADACRLARVAKACLEVVASMDVFKQCGDARLDDYFILGANFPFNATHGFLCKRKAGPYMPPAMIVVERNWLAPKWFAVAELQNGRYEWYVIEFKTAEVLTYVRCPPGFKEAFAAKNDRPASELWDSYPYPSNALPPTHSSSMSDVQPATLRPKKILLKRGIGTPWFEPWWPTSVRVRCDTARRMRAIAQGPFSPNGLPHGKYMYKHDENLVLITRGVCTDRWSTHEFHFDRAVRVAAGYDPTQPCVRAVTFKPAKGFAATPDGKAYLMAPVNSAADLTPSPVLKAARHALGRARALAVLADEDRGSDAEIDDERDLIATNGNGNGASSSRAHWPSATADDPIIISSDSEDD